MNGICSLKALLEVDSLDGLYPVLDQALMTPGWHKRRPSLWPSPRTAFTPRHWRYRDGLIALDQAGRWIGTELAERRNLLLFNPVGDNDYDTVRTLVAAYQMVKPGEHARAHRHSPNAIRIVLDAPDGCFTVVDGTRLPMRNGDVLLTPANTWHSHFNDGDANAYWIDILDVPLVHLLEPMFVEFHPSGHQAVTSSPDSHAFRSPLADVLPRLEATSRAWPLDIGKHIPTFEVIYRPIPAGQFVQTGRTTESRILCMLQGIATAVIGDQRFDLAHGDVLAVPSWHPLRLEAASDCLLLEVTDEPALRKLGFMRVE